jgi:hypothetical protein
VRSLYLAFKLHHLVSNLSPHSSQTKVPPGYNSIPTGTRDLSRTPHPAMSDRLLARGGEGLDMNHVMAQLFTNSREEILAALNTLQRRSYDPDFDLTQYPLAFDHLMVVARNVWITVSQQDATPFSKKCVFHYFHDYHDPHQPLFLRQRPKPLH